MPEYQSPEINTSSQHEETLKESNQEIEQAVIEELGNVKPDVIIILSAGITNKVSKSGERWTSVAWGTPNELDIHTGARTRIIAGAEIAKVLPDTPIVTTSFNKNDATEPTMASVVKQELINRKVDEDRIIEESESFSTITQYIEMLKLAQKFNWDNIAVVINEYYQPRANALWNNLAKIVDDSEIQKLWNDFKDRNGQVVFIKSEPILRAMSDKMVKYLEEVYKTPYYQDTLRNEARGVQAIESGNYKYTIKPNV